MDETRRALVRQGLVVAAGVAALSAGTAFADHDDDKDDDHDDDRKRRGPDRPPALRRTTFSSDLARVGDANADFGSPSVGSDPLQDGRVRLLVRRNNAQDAHVQVTLRGAAANATYEVFFVPLLTPRGGESLGNVGPTDGRGNLNDVSSGALGGKNRVGLFKLVRRNSGNAEDGKDEFVSALGA